MIHNFTRNTSDHTLVGNLRFDLSELGWDSTTTETQVVTGDGAAAELAIEEAINFEGHSEK